MTQDPQTRNRLAAFMTALAALLWLIPTAGAHCDTMDGPVVAEARAALAAGDVTAVLKWVAAEQEPEVRAAFERTQAVRDKGPEARELADLYFFETLVRLHRAAEGEPYTGLQPVGTPVPPALQAADQALAEKDVAALAEEIARQVEAGIRERFRHAAEARTHAGESVHAGREYVAAYVNYMHYVERIHELATGRESGHSHGQVAPAAHGHAEEAPAGHGQTEDPHGHEAVPQGHHH